jgi:hypothetical protein
MTECAPLRNQAWIHSRVTARLHVWPRPISTSTNMARVHGSINNPMPSFNTHTGCLSDLPLLVSAAVAQNFWTPRMPRYLIMLGWAATAAQILDSLGCAPNTTSMRSLSEKRLLRPARRRTRDTGVSVWSV